MGFSVTKITSAIKNNYGKYLAKAAGAAAVGMVAYDAHVIGKLRADTYSQTSEANRTASFATNTLYLSEPSTIQSKVKKKLFNLELENNFLNFFNSAAGYFSGLGEMLVSGVVPLGLGLTALLAGVKKHGKICKGAGIGLLVYGGIKLVRDILGAGRPDPLNSRFK